MSSLNLRLRSDAAYARHEGQTERAKLMDEAADEIEQLRNRVSEMGRELGSIYGLDIPVEPIKSLPAAEGRSDG